MSAIANELRLTAEGQGYNQRERMREAANEIERLEKLYETLSFQRDTYKADWVEGLKQYGAARAYIERLEALAWHAADRLGIWHREAPERAGQFVGDLAKELEAVLAQGYPGSGDPAAKNERKA